MNYVYTWKTFEESVTMTTFAVNDCVLYTIPLDI